MGWTPPHLSTSMCQTEIDISVNDKIEVPGSIGICSPSTSTTKGFPPLFVMVLVAGSKVTLASSSRVVVAAVPSVAINVMSTAPAITSVEALIVALLQVAITSSTRSREIIKELEQIDTCRGLASPDGAAAVLTPAGFGSSEMANI